MDIKPKQFPNEYETTFILTPELPGDEQKSAVDKFIQLIKDNGGTVNNTEHWGMRKLAYPINKKSSGYYVFVEFTGNGEFVAVLDQAYRYDERVLRFLTVKMDKHHFEFNKKRREQGFGLRKEAKNIS
ncbi:30S ribosomal protein S6 [Pontibacter sp. G13]|uniref:30S ribosomal protein S6 n=1 Tax=Pontibacter sp. G13 TaxID=3074898 RepID=UPI0028897EAE|nr:30S ribosomal protein S6 [Pontibacter sp. G13]WNJ16717.1 30S ribosomal protein S6 [Pontibacter sp. G13]